MNTSVGGAEFVRQLYNLRHVLERDKEAGDTKTKIQLFQNKIHLFKTDIDQQGHGYEIIVDDDGDIWEPLLDLSGHVY
jgi:hypothetical protein